MLSLRCRWDIHEELLSWIFKPKAHVIDLREGQRRGQGLGVVRGRERRERDFKIISMYSLKHWAALNRPEMMWRGNIT